MRGVEISIDVSDELTPAFKRLIGQLERPKPMLREFGGYLQRRWRNSMGNAPKHSLDSATEGEPPLRHTGGFQRSIIWLVLGQTLYVGSTFIGAEMLQEGGTIYSNDVLLTIPLVWKARGKRARDWPKVLTFVPSPDWPSGECHGTLREKDSGKIIYALMEEVTIAPHPWATFEAQDASELEQIVTRHLSVD